MGPATYYTHRVESDATTNVTSTLPGGSIRGEGVFAGTLNGSGFALTNNGAATDTAGQHVKQAGTQDTFSLDTRGGHGAADGTVGGAASGDSGAGAGSFGGTGKRQHPGRQDGHSSSGASGAAGTTYTRVPTLNGQTAISFVAVNAANGVSGTSFGGINIPVPSNPNGLYVVAKEPNAQYLVESNPRYRVGATSVGSDYLAQQLGYDPDTLVRRLGDASYEAYLIKQELVAQTGNSLLAGSADASTQVKRLMDQAAAQSKDLGLTYGEALTPEQQAGLKQDIVWMVQTEVNGQVVLASRWCTSRRRPRSTSRPVR